MSDVPVIDAWVNIVPEAFAAKLKESGVATTEDLLEKAGTSSGRKQLADEVGAQASQILT